MTDSGTAQLGLSTALPFKFELTAPPDDLGDLVNTFFAIRVEEGHLDEIMPAYSAQILLFVTGSAVLRPAQGQPYRSETLCFSAPLLEATPVIFEGPATILGASLTALGWQALSGLAADKVNARLLPGSRVIGAEATSAFEALAEQLAQTSEGEDRVFTQMANLLRARRGALDPAHVAIVNRIMAWLGSDLSPPIDELYAGMNASTRTVQRVARRFFGVPPSRLVKRFRAIRAAMLLANPDLPQAMRDMVIGAYFDQAHLIRDIRRYTGRTPTQLTTGKIIEDTLAPEAHGTAARLLREGSK